MPNRLLARQLLVGRNSRELVGCVGGAPYDDGLTDHISPYKFRVLYGVVIYFI